MDLGWEWGFCDMTQGEGCHDPQGCDELKILLRFLACLLRSPAIIRRSHEDTQRGQDPWTPASSFLGPGQPSGLSGAEGVPRPRWSHECSHWHDLRAPREPWIHRDPTSDTALRHISGFRPPRGPQAPIYLTLHHSGSLLPIMIPAPSHHTQVPAWTRHYGAPRSGLGYSPPSLTLPTGTRAQSLPPLTC